MRKTVCVLMTLAIGLLGSIAVFADSVVPLPQGVTEAMCRADYWKDKTVCDADRVLLNNEQIAALNRAAVDGAGTYVFDIENMPAYNAARLQQSITPTATAGKSYFVKGSQIDVADFYERIITAIRTTGFTETNREPDYAVTVRDTCLRDIPVDYAVGYSAEDPDDELLSESLTVNEPFVIHAKCEFEGKTYYYGYTLDCTGWICGDDLALCADKAQWLDAWKCEPGSDDFIVVTTDKITLEKAVLQPNASELKLRMGCTLKLVPEEDIPVIIGERGSWNNYIVYIPVRLADGSYAKEVAMVPQHCRVNVGFLDYTQGNVLDVAFTALGNTYGWAGWLESWDCSMYTRSVYRCFGIFFPRNTTWQQKVPGTKYDLSAMDDAEKMKFIQTMPAGSLLFMSGHVVMYLGSENGVAYVISALGKVVESSGDKTVNSIYSVCVTPLTVRRNASYNFCTWLNAMTSAVVITPAFDLKECTAKATAACTDDALENPCCELSRNGMPLYEGVNYSVTQNGSTVTFTGMGLYEGTVEVPIENPHPDEDDNDVCDECGDYISGNLFTHILFMIRKFFQTVFGSLNLCK